MERVEFGPSVIPELREILDSMCEATYYGPDGRVTDVREEPFLEEWRLTRLDFDPALGRGRLLCVLAREGREVTAIIDARDFPDLRSNTSKSREWNGSDNYHDLAVLLSTMLQEEFLSRDPDDLGSEIHIRLPPDTDARP